MSRKSNQRSKSFYRLHWRTMLVALVCLATALLAIAGLAATREARKSASAAQNQKTARNLQRTVTARPAARQALAAVESAAGQNVTSFVARETGVYSFVRAGGDALLAQDDARLKPEARALAFLSAHGALVGMSDSERAFAAEQSAVLSQGNQAATTSAGSDLQTLRVVEDEIGEKHVRLNQYYHGLQVFGAQVVVHMNERGITAVNGTYVPDINDNLKPAISEKAATQAAAGFIRKQARINQVTVNKVEMGIYRKGLLEGYYGENVLAYNVEVAGTNLLEQVWIDARTGGLLIRIPLKADALYRIAYTPKYDSSNPDMFVARREGEAAHPVPAINDIYDFTGQTYNFYASAFGRDSYDNAGHTMRTVYLVNDQCPNAYWDGSTTNYCPDITADDVVSHEWSHAYTQFTHGLIYSYQSGALNEAYSDIFGETVDLINGRDGSGGSDNTNHAIYGPAGGVGPIVQIGGGQRFRIGEDVQSLNQPALGILRDMYQPAVFGNADKVSSANYTCGSADNGGVHNNSGVPNHAYALMVDGGTFNGQTITGIGLTKAAAIYFRAESVYQVPTTNFANHEQSIRAAAADLVGAQLYELNANATTRTPSSEVITAADLVQVGKAMDAVEMSQPASQCGFTPLLDPNTPASCNGASTIFSDDFESGNLTGWSLADSGTFAGWPHLTWQAKGQLPENRAGKAAFAVDPQGGACGDPNGDYSGRFSMDSPQITVPAGASNLKLNFDHFVETEADVDGGNLYVSVNNGAFAAVPKANMLFNAYNSTLRAAPPTDQNTNPKAGEDAWTGSNIGTGMGSWGTSIVDLSSLAHPGDQIKIRFEFGLDGCGGGTGWYIDNVRVYSCPTLSAPVLSLGTDYGNPDTDGSYTLNWTRPAGASGPDTVQESYTSCGPVLSDNAEGGIANWNVASAGGTAQLRPTWETSGAKPNHSGNAFWAHGTEESVNTNTTLTFKNPISIPDAGTTTLNFSDWYFNEEDDKGTVEVSTDGGTNWTAVYTNNRAGLADSASTAFAGEDLVAQHVDLTPYHGQAIRLRFNYALGESDFVFKLQLGWYVDDISLVSDNWSNIGTTTGTSQLVSGRLQGTRCYRVRSSYTFGPDIVQSPVSNVVQAVSTATQLCTLPLPTRAPVSDFDGDGKTDIAVWQPNNGNWNVIRSSNGSTATQATWGLASLGDIAVPGDYDGDKKVDIAVWRAPEGNWYIIKSTTNTTTVQNWGGTGDRPVAADYDGDGKTDVAVFRPSEGNWYIRRSSDNTVMVKGWGASNDKLVPGDYDRDGRADIAVYRPSEGNWYIIQSATNTVRLQNWGQSGDVPVPADYDGDGKTDVAIFRPNEGNWYIIQSCAGTVALRNWGGTGDVPVPGDYDGDQKADIAIFRPNEGNWYIVRSSNGAAGFFYLGGGSDQPLPSIYPAQ